MKIVVKDLENLINIVYALAAEGYLLSVRPYTDDDSLGIRKFEIEIKGNLNES